MTAFYIGQHEIDDEMAFAEYLKQTIPFIEKHGGRYLTKAGTHEMLEGQLPNRVVVVEFPSKQAIKDWYNDPDYQPLIAKRRAAARSVMIAVEGRTATRPDYLFPHKAFNWIVAYFCWAWRICVPVFDLFPMIPASSSHPHVRYWPLVSCTAHVRFRM